MLFCGYAKSFRLGSSIKVPNINLKLTNKNLGTLKNNILLENLRIISNRIRETKFELAKRTISPKFIEKLHNVLILLFTKTFLLKIKGLI